MTVIDGTGRSGDRVIDIRTMAGGLVTVSGVTLDGGRLTSDSGGGILAKDGQFAAIDTSTVSGSDGGQWGGGVFTRAATTITHSTITGNAAGEAGAG